MKLRMATRRCGLVLVAAITLATVTTSAASAMPNSVTPAAAAHHRVAASLTITGGEVAPASCNDQDGYSEQTPYHWTQQLRSWVCAVSNGWEMAGSVTFAREAGFNASHVTGCTVHIRLHHIGGSASEQTADCTDSARNDSVFTIGTRGWTGIGPGTYVLSGWVNIQTGPTTHYEGSPYASAVEWDLS